MTETPSSSDPSGTAAHASSSASSAASSSGAGLSGADIAHSPADPALPAGLRLLQGLVIALTLTMILAVITVVGLLVTRAPRVFGTAPPALPSTLELPAGTRALAVTQGTGWVAVVTDDDRILIFDRQGALTQEIAVTTGSAP